MKLVIAEKPSVAQSLSAVIGATARKDGYLEGSGWRVSWCVGHLAGLADADSISKIDLSEIDYGICKYPSMGNDVESKAMSVTTMAFLQDLADSFSASTAVQAS